MFTILLVAFAMHATALVLPRDEPPVSFLLSMVSADATMPDGYIMDHHVPCYSFTSGQQFSLVNGKLTRGNDLCFIHKGSLVLECSAKEVPSSMVEDVKFGISNTNLLTHDDDDQWLHCIDDHAHFSCYSNNVTARVRESCLNMTLEVTEVPKFQVQERSTSLLLNDTTGANTTSVATCPTGSVAAGNEFQFPHLIVPVRSDAPNQSFGTQYDATFSPTTSTLFNFDIPFWAPYPTSTCNLVFLFPFDDELSPYTPQYTFSGSEAEVESGGGVNFALLNGVADGNTNYNNKPPVAIDYGLTQIIPGNEYTIATFPCQGGRFTYEASAVGELSLNYWQASAPAPIGLYIVPCSN